MNLMQLIINVIYAASIYAVVAYSYYFMYSARKFLNMSHAAIIALGAYLAFEIKKQLAWNIFIVIPFSVAITAIIAITVFLLIFKPLQKRKASSTKMLVASLGIYLVLQNLISLIWLDAPKSLCSWPVKRGHNILDVYITNEQILMIVVSIALLGVLLLFSKKTTIGKSIRAVASDSVLADVSGIDSYAVVLWAFAISSGLGGLAGILIAIDVDMTPTMGMNAFMMGVVTVIIGGVNSILGIALAALLLAITQHFGAWFIGSQWQDAIAFVILVLFLLFKPEGFFGKKVKSATV
ncbi:MAG: branched-chain amino acid ABC transporter permease [Planctomycetes bacterium]|nr:branched-chain amino acid ABC transporter permease [Planctomycetota bacterium]